MNDNKKLEEDSSRYIQTLKNFFPNIKLSPVKDLISLYKNISYIYDLCDIILEFNYISNDLYKTMVKEYAEFNSKILITVGLKDRNLVNCYFRMIIEKLYRLIYIQFKSPKTELKIRRKSQENIYNELKSTSAKESLDKIYPLFDMYSKEIHNYESHKEDLYSVIFSLKEKDFPLSNYIESIKILNKVFKKEIFDKLLPDFYNCPVAIKKRLEKYYVLSKSKRIIL